MSKSITDILWNFYHELKEQQDSGRSVREGNAEIISQTKSALLKIIIREKPPKEEAKFATGDFEIDIKTRGKIEGFNQGADEYEKSLTALFNREV